MLGFLGPAELILILLLASIVIAHRKLPELGRSFGVSISRFLGTERVPPDAARYDARPDWRYARGFRPGAIAELFGMGTYGLRWKQTLVVVLGTWLTFMFEAFATGSLPGATESIWLSIAAIVFVFSAITAARSFQSALAIAIFTGVMYFLLYISLRFAAHQPDFSNPEEMGYWIRWGISFFTWPTLTMFALEFAVSGTRRWMRMACALFAASAVETYIGEGVYFGNWSPKSLLEVLASGRIVTMIIAALIWTIAFRIGQTRFGDN